MKVYPGLYKSLAFEYNIGILQILVNFGISSETNQAVNRDLSQNDSSKRLVFDIVN